MFFCEVIIDLEKKMQISTEFPHTFPQLPLTPTLTQPGTAIRNQPWTRPHTAALIGLRAASRRPVLAPQGPSRLSGRSSRASCLLQPTAIALSLLLPDLETWGGYEPAAP